MSTIKVHVRNLFQFDHSVGQHMFKGVSQSNCSCTSEPETSSWVPTPELCAAIKTHFAAGSSAHQSCILSQGSPCSYSPQSSLTDFVFMCHTTSQAPLLSCQTHEIITPHDRLNQFLHIVCIKPRDTLSHRVLVQASLVTNLHFYCAKRSKNVT